MFNSFREAWSFGSNRHYFGAGVSLTLFLLSLITFSFLPLLISAFGGWFFLHKIHENYGG